VGRTFRPEFVNRIDRIVVFKPLSRELMYRILRKELAGVLDRRGLKHRDWAVEWEPSALDFLIDKGFSAQMGARPLKRAIDQHLLAPLAATLVEHRFPQGDQFLFVRSGGAALEVEFVDPYAEPGAEPDAPAAPRADLDLPGLILAPEADPGAAAFLAARAAALHAALEADDWRQLKARLTQAASDPEIWGRDDRTEVFSGLNLIDRVQEAARTVDRLAGRLARESADKISRELVQRLALQLHLTEAGLADALAGAPTDAVLSVEPALEGGAEPSPEWRARVLGMYRAWAERRRMQLDVIEPKPDTGSGAGPILHISGFGAWRTLAPEQGLHLLEHPPESGQRREAARVRVEVGPDEEIPPARLHATLAARLAAAPASQRVVRRYRQQPSPLVRDAASKTRSGHLATVLAGDFDLVFPRGA
jgi:ATP-dependent Clp protease ATP-binding subunit ClpC